MSLEARKISLVQYILSLQKEDILEQIETFTGRYRNDLELPQWQKDELDRRMKDLEQNPNSTIDFDKALEDIRKKHGL